MRDRLLLGAVIVFAIGIAIGARIEVPVPLTLFLGLVALVLIALRRPSSIAVGVLLLACATGLVRASLVLDAAPEAFQKLFDTKVELLGVVATDPDLRETTQRVTVRVTHEGEAMKLLAVAPLYPELSFGEHVIVRGKLERPEPFATDTGREFRYDRFLAKDGVFAIVPFAQVEVVNEPSVFDRARGSLYAVKRAFARGLERALPEPYAALAGGILTGGKQGLGEKLLDAFTVAGLVHVVVLSGYNVMIVAEAILRSLAVLPRRMATTVAALSVALFVLAAGAGPASIRAGLMALVALYARASGRTYDALRALLFVFVVMLLVNPSVLLDDPGFQLSFVATAGLILAAPAIEARLGWVRPALLRDVLSTTLAAQLFVLPLLLYSTGALSLAALPANALALPILPLTMLLSAVAGVAGVLLPVAAPFIGIPALTLLAYVTWIAEATASLPFAQVTVSAFPVLFVPVMYVAIALLVLRLKENAPAGGGRVLREGEA